MKIQQDVLLIATLWNMKSDFLTWGPSYTKTTFETLKIGLLRVSLKYWRDISNHFVSFQN